MSYRPSASLRSSLSVSYAIEERERSLVAVKGGAHASQSSIEMRAFTYTSTEGGYSKEDMIRREEDSRQLKNPNCMSSFLPPLDFSCYVHSTESSEKSEPIAETAPMPGPMPEPLEPMLEALLEPVPGEGGGSR